jgi:hypothetical protein
MKKLIYLFVFLLAISACKKESKEKISISKDVIEKLNNYKPDFNEFDGLINNFCKQRKAHIKNIACANNPSALKSFVVIDDIPADLAKCLMEMFLNYENGHIMDSTLREFKSERNDFTIVVDNISPEGIPELNGNDFMAKFAAIDSFLKKNNTEEALKYATITLSKIENGLAYFSCEKNIGKAQGFVLGTDHFTSAQPDVMSIFPYLCDGITPSLEGYNLINSYLFNYSNQIPQNQSSGTVMLFYNFSPTTARYGKDLINNPNIGTGTYGSAGLIWDKWRIGCYPNHCLSYDSLNQFLDGARLIYQVNTAGMALNHEAYVKYRLGGSLFYVEVMGPKEWHMAMPIVFQTANYHYWLPTADPYYN